MFPKLTKKVMWCPPLTIYLIISLVGLFLMMRQKATLMEHLQSVIVQLLWVSFWSYIMYAMCDSGRTGFSWVILLLPVVVWAVMSLLILVGIVKSQGACRWMVGDKKLCMSASSRSDCNAVMGSFVAGDKC